MTAHAARDARSGAHLCAPPLPSWQPRSFSGLLALSWQERSPGILLSPGHSTELRLPSSRTRFSCRLRCQMMSVNHVIHKGCLPGSIKAARNIRRTCGAFHDQRRHVAFPSEAQPSRKHYACYKKQACYCPRRRDRERVQWHGHVDGRSPVCRQTRMIGYPRWLNRLVELNHGKVVAHRSGVDGEIAKARLKQTLEAVGRQQHHDRAYAHFPVLLIIVKSS